MPTKNVDDLFYLQPPLPTEQEAKTLRDMGWSNVPLHNRLGMTYAGWWLPPWHDPKKSWEAYTTTEALQLSRERGMLPTLMDEK